MTWRETVLSQYEHSPRLMSVAKTIGDGLNAAAGAALILKDEIDIKTAGTWGLDVWGRILGLSRTIELKGSNEYFGFVGSGLQPFNVGTFYRARITSTYTLGDDAYRTFLMLKAAANISDTSVPTLNKLLQFIFAGRGKAYVLEVGTMKIRFVFEFVLEPFERALMLRQDVPPKPAGVGYEVFSLAYPAFGFAGSGHHPFNQGTFIQGGPENAYRTN